MMAQCMTSTRSTVAFKSRAAQRPSRGSLKVQAFKVGQERRVAAAAPQAQPPRFALHKL